MDGIREFLDAVHRHGLFPGHLRAVMHVSIGRRIARADGTVLSNGITWRELSVHFRDLRLDRELVRELGTDPESLPPRDRQRFWYSAIALAHVHSQQALSEAEQFIRLVTPLGFVIGDPPMTAGARPTESPPPIPTPNPTSTDTDAASKPKPRKK